MKKILATLFVSFMVLGLFAQTSMYKEGDWKEGETKTISGTTIKKISGKNSPESITNIGYQTQKQLLVDLKERKKKGSIGGDKYKMEEERVQKYCAGGLVQLYITRPTEEACNAKWFNLKVMDHKGKLIFEKQYRDEAPTKFKDGSGYKNQSLGFISSEAFLPITIEIVENYNGKEEKYVYEVTEAL